MQIHNHGPMNGLHSYLIEKWTSLNVGNSFCWTSCGKYSDKWENDTWVLQNEANKFLFAYARDVYKGQTSLHINHTV